MEKTYNVKGMTCIICKANVEKALNNCVGVNSAQVNLLENEVTINYDEKIVSDEILFKTIKDAGYELINLNTKTNDIKDYLILLSIIIELVLMYFSMNNIYMLWQAMLSFIIIILNIDIYKSGIRSLIKLNPNMYSLVCISSIVSYIYSLYVLIFRQNSNYHYYFETASMVLLIVTIGKRIEAKAKTKATKVIRGLSTLIPMQANLIINDEIKIIPIDDIKKNDIVLVKPGESIPQDGIIISGSSSIDESMITGESKLAEKTIDDEVIGGTVNVNGTLQIRITKPKATTALSNIINLTKKAIMEKMPIERQADIISRYFVYIVIGISLLTFVIWILTSKDIEKSLNFALSVLVISCPCALGLATPAAISVCVGKAAKSGILIKKPEVLEIILKTKNIIFDKTGTLTNNKLDIVDTIILDNDFINILSSIEKTSNHPIAKTILETYNEGNIIFDETNFIFGQGIIAKKDKDIYKAGNDKLINNIPSKYIETAINNNYSFIALEKNNQLYGLIYLTDNIRTESIKAIANLYKRNINPIMCTGDNKIAARRIAEMLKIKEYQYETLPEDKNNLVNEKKKQGIVMMAGDGINDAIAMSNADVSITISQASDIASSTSDVILMKNDLNDIPYLYDLSKKTMRIIKQNLLWALFYNSICIPVAAGALYNSYNISLNPMLASVTMFISSIFVIINALRINTVKKEDTIYEQNSNN